MLLKILRKISCSEIQCLSVYSSISPKFKKNLKHYKSLRKKNTLLKQYICFNTVSKKDEKKWKEGLTVFQKIRIIWIFSWLSIISEMDDRYISYVYTSTPAPFTKIWWIVLRMCFQSWKLCSVYLFQVHFSTAFRLLLLPKKWTTLGNTCFLIKW